MTATIPNQDNDEYNIDDPTERWERGIPLSGHWCSEHRHFMQGSNHPVCHECESERNNREWKLKVQDMESELQRLTLENIDLRKRLEQKEGD